MARACGNSGEQPEEWASLMSTGSLLFSGADFTEKDQILGKTIQKCDYFLGGWEYFKLMFKYNSFF